MRHARLIARWLLFVGCFTAIGVGVFHFVRYSPRCEVRGRFGGYEFSADGSHLVTVPERPDLPQQTSLDPVQVWDTASGDLMNTYWNAGEFREFYLLGSARVVGQRASGALSVLHWTTGDEWVIEERFDSGLSPLGDRQYAGVKKGGSVVIVDPLKKDVFDLGIAELNGIHGDRANVTKEGSAAIWSLTDHTEINRLKLETADLKMIWVLWNVRSNEPLVRLTFPLIGKTIFSHCSNDGRFQIVKVCDLENLSTGNLHAVDTLRGTNWNVHIFGDERVIFCPDSLCSAVVDDGPARSGRTRMLEAATGRVLWEKPGRCAPVFLSPSAVILGGQIEPELVDAVTGRPLRAPSGIDLESILRVENTPDRRHCLITTVNRRRGERRFWEKWLDDHWPRLFGSGRFGTIVLETESLNPLLSLVEFVGENATLADNASLLATRGWEGDTQIIRIYDVHPARAWRWAIGVALGSALAWQSILFAWRRLRKRKAATV